MPIDRTPGSKCAICGRLASDAHHYVFRSRGGTDDQTMPLCHDCHMDIHNERLRIDVESLDSLGILRVYDVRANAKVIDRPIAADLEQWADEVAEDEVRRLSNWVHSADLLYRLYTGWVLRDEHGQLETRKTMRINAIAKRCQMEPGTARQQIDVAIAFWPRESDNPRLADAVERYSIKHFTVWRKAASQPNPTTAMEQAEDFALSVENASAEMLVAAIEERKPKTLYIRTPQDPALLGQWVPFSELEHERR